MSLFSTSWSQEMYISPRLLLNIMLVLPSNKNPLTKQRNCFMTSLLHKRFDSMSVEVKINHTKQTSEAVQTPPVPAQSTLLFQLHWNQRVLSTTSGARLRGMTVHSVTQKQSHCCSHWDF